MGRDGAAGRADRAGGRMIVAISLALGAIGGLCWCYLIWSNP